LAPVLAIFLSLLVLSPLLGKSYQDPTGRPTPPVKHRKPRNSAQSDATALTLTIITDPPQCQVIINGEDHGVSDADGKLTIDKLAAGHMDIEVGKTGYVTAHRGFEGGTEQPTLEFKLDISLEDELRNFEALISAGKLIGPEKPNAVELVMSLSKKYPDRTEVIGLRTRLVSRLIDFGETTAKKTVTDWRNVTPDELVQAQNASSTAVGLKDDEPRALASDVYMEGVARLRRWEVAPVDAKAQRDHESKPEDHGPTGTHPLAEVKLRLENAAQIDQSWAPPRYQLGQVLLLLDEPAGAEAAFRDAIRLEPTWTIPHLGLGRALFLQHKYKEAVDELRRSTILDPSCSACYAELGLAIATAGPSKDEMNEAMTHIRKSMALDPDSGLPHLDLGIIYSESKKKKENELATEELKRAIELNKANLEFQNSVAEKILDDLKNGHKKRSSL
jgi:tetratricopeptide (TPR) repeat protein